MDIISNIDLNKSNESDTIHHYFQSDIDDEFTNATYKQNSHEYDNVLSIATKCKKCFTSINEGYQIYYYKILNNSQLLNGCINNFDKLCSHTQIDIATNVLNYAGCCISDGLYVYGVLEGQNSYIINLNDYGKKQVKCYSSNGSLLTIYMDK